MAFESTFKAIDNTLHHDDGCSTALDYVEQSSWVLFLKYFDDDHIESSGSDNNRLLALSRNEGTFESRFNLSNDPTSLLLGYIVLSISHVTIKYDTKYYVSLSYCTSDNAVEQLASADDDL